ncbi:hypothetical protein KBX37_23905 [Micromonospora sp. U56]|uniref:hypothetical protein n=1 Tax=Micromonospora sp. U56 TaxID=2824900 RepID=UPI001B396CD4|nr:hypothetical protein [Micromonospora sp. U56]MBQ0896102.1 hypothetical protein [Micromonospora sp. U56]
MTAALSLSILTGCTTEPENVDGEAGPAGAPSATATAGASAAASSTTPSAIASAAVSPSAATSTTPSAAPSISGRTSEIRKTDWANVTLANLDYLGLGDVRFRNGRGSSGANNCTMLPGGARPAYAEFLTEEPANSPVTEDALILIECGSDGMDQALIPVKLGFDQKTRETIGFIQADPSSGPDSRMTFTSYTIARGVIVTTVRKADGAQETRRYRFAGGTSWERA